MEKTAILEFVRSIDFLVSFSRILMRHADNLHRHKISDEFEFWPDRTIDWSYFPFSAKNAIFDLVRSIDCFALSGSL